MRPPLPADDLERVLSLTSALWPSFRDARVFITGGTGFIGTWLVEVLLHANRHLNAGMEIVVLSRNPAKAQVSAPHIFSDRSVAMIEGDVSYFRQPVGKFDLCIHAATDVGDTGRTKNLREIFDSTLSGTRRVLDLAENSGVKRFLLTSSGAIYGTQPPDHQRLAESFAGAPDPLNSAAAYGNAKRAAEWLSCEAMERANFQGSIARIFALVGPGLPLDGPFAAGNFIRDALNHQPIRLQGDGRTVRSYLYMLDACVWLLQILMNGDRGHAYNVGSEDEVSVMELARRVVAAAGESLPICAPPVLDNVLPARYVPDTTKARVALSLEQYTSLDTALQKTVQWSRQAMLA